jgi:hypothetical protein
MIQPKSSTLIMAFSFNVYVIKNRAPFVAMVLFGANLDFYGAVHETQTGGPKTQLHGKLRVFRSLGWRVIPNKCLCTDMVSLLMKNVTKVMKIGCMWPWGVMGGPGAGVAGGLGGS